MSEIKNFKKSSFVKKYLLADSLVSKLIFLILVAVIFVLLLRVATSVIGYLFGPKNKPYIVKGLQEGNIRRLYSQDPNKSNSISILRSKNQESGIEFTYSVWLNVNYKQPNNTTYYNHVFSKGSTEQMNIDMNGIYYPNNAPGMYLDMTSSDNNLVIIMNTMSGTDERIVINRIPLQKWLCVVLRVKGKILDVYINGIITKRQILNDVPKQNYEDIIVAGGQLNGFNGQLSSLRYYNYALSINEINSILRKGPNLKADIKTALSSRPPYLSTDWYFYNDKI
tara:strand:- start:922 stop:1764 length:843 start_codon:yes stop_codon:yes gene_type:complete